MKEKLKPIEVEAFGAENLIDEIIELWEIGKRTAQKLDASAAASKALISAFKYNALERGQTRHK